MGTVCTILILLALFDLFINKGEVLQAIVNKFK